MDMRISLPKPVFDALERLENHGYTGYAVGGCVRDTLLGREPHDWDITTSAHPEQIKACFAGERVIETGIRHGTVTVLLDGTALEITTYRTDGVYLDNRHPSDVTFSERVEDDLSRRDFTVNAMAYHPSVGIVDLFGGREDLANGLIRCVGDAETRFREDGLRILRAIRFASVLGFDVEKQTAAAVHACRGLLSNIAFERIREEFCKLLCGRNAVQILREYSDVIGEFLPEMEACVGYPQQTKYHCYDVYEHILHALSGSSPDLITRLSIFFHDVGKPLCMTRDAEAMHFKGHANVGADLTAEMMKRLKFDHDTAERVTKLVKLHGLEILPEPRAVKRLMQKLSDEDISRWAELRRQDRLAHAPLYCESAYDPQEIPRMVAKIREADECLSLSKLQVRGDDLIAIGILPGKKMGNILSYLLDAVVDGECPNEKEALLALAARRAADSE